MTRPVDDLVAWAPYLRAFDAHLAARAGGHPFTAGLARLEMVRLLEASPDYWRMRRVNATAGYRRAA